LLGQLIFSRFRGRLARKPYWIGIAAIVALRASASVLAQSSFGPAVVLEGSELLLAGVAALVGARLRDFGRSAIWGWLGMALIEVATLAVAVGTWPREHGAIVISEIPRPAVILNGALLLVLVGLVGLIRGDPGPNRFGPAPAGAPPAAPRETDDADDAAPDIDALIARTLAARAAGSGEPRAKPAPELGARAPLASAAPVFGKRR